MEVVKLIVDILLFLFKVTVAVLIIICIPALYEKVRIFLLKKEVKEYLFAHMMKLKGDGRNRFVADYNTLQEVFPDKSSYYLLLVWESLVKDGTIKKDELDGEWVIK